jgi:hypothetical protein
VTCSPRDISRGCEEAVHPIKDERQRRGYTAAAGLAALGAAKWCMHAGSLARPLASLSSSIVLPNRRLEKKRPGMPLV